ncbi:hypothetical protein CDAR_385401 [Caerostris darwini]|uniref:Uncharacterized protein n=1 Tax=Caerostris darwini TaxID=1538125 RepID=A0AAV4MZY2_9ARAC|nr:hypothetical protein CDAR_385401 [Caerostris darwini]
MPPPEYEPGARRRKRNSLDVLAREFNQIHGRKNLRAEDLHRETWSNIESVTFLTFLCNVIRMRQEGVWRKATAGGDKRRPSEEFYLYFIRVFLCGGLDRKKQSQFPRRECKNRSSFEIPGDFYKHLSHPQSYRPPIYARPPLQPCFASLYRIGLLFGRWLLPVEASSKIDGQAGFSTIIGNWSTKEFSIIIGNWSTKEFSIISWKLEHHEIFYHQGKLEHHRIFCHHWKLEHSEKRSSFMIKCIRNMLEPKIYSTAKCCRCLCSSATGFAGSVVSVVTGSVVSVVASSSLSRKNSIIELFTVP